VQAQDDLGAKTSVFLKDTTMERHVSNEAKSPRNPSANVLPTEGYFLEIDGKLKTEHATSDAASKAGLELKKKYPSIQVNVYAAKERTRMQIKLPA
jgi:hypothetical protein